MPLLIKGALKDYRLSVGGQNSCVFQHNWGLNQKCLVLGKVLICLWRKSAVSIYKFLMWRWMVAVFLWYKQLKEGGHINKSWGYFGIHSDSKSFNNLMSFRHPSLMGHLVYLLFENNHFYLQCLQCYANNNLELYCQWKSVMYVISVIFITTL